MPTGTIDRKPPNERLRKQAVEAAARVASANDYDLAKLCADLRIMLAASSKGPWVPGDRDAIVAPNAEDPTNDSHFYGAKLVCESFATGPANQALIVAMRNTLPRLLDAVEATLSKAQP